MATGPISSQATGAASRMHSARPLVAIAGVAAAAWFMNQSFQGNKDVWEQNAANHHTEGEYRFMREAWGHESGHPYLDHLEHKMKGLLHYGPHGLGTHYHEAQAYRKGFINDVILNNLFPIILAVASIYVGFTPKVVHSSIGRFFRALKPGGRGSAATSVTNPATPHVPATPANATPVAASRVSNISGRAGNAFFTGVGKTSKGVGWLFTGGRAPITLIVLAFGAYTAHQFLRVWRHTAQEDRFRGFIHGNEH